MNTLTLEYKRVGHAYDGRIHLNQDGKHISRGSFEQISFEDVMARVATVLMVVYDVRVFFKRTEREGLQPVEIVGEELEELKRNPLAFAQARTMEHRVIHVRDKVQAADAIEVTVRAGHDTLADAFGDELYLRRRDKKVESPMTGRWVDLDRDDPSEPFYIFAGGVVSHGDGPEPYGGTDITVREAGEQWVTTRTDELLQQEWGRYYLPRAWNESGSWISHEDLKQKYEQYLKEKSDAVDR